MSPRRAERREALLARSAAQRARIALQLAPAVRVAGIADRVVSTVRAHPVAFTRRASAVSTSGCAPRCA